MLAFGHFSFALFLLSLFLPIRESLLLAPLSMLPDIDLFIGKFLGIKHRTLTHSVLFLPIFMVIVYIYSLTFRLDLSLRELVLISLVLYLSHLIGDIILGNGVELFPGLFVNSLFQDNEVIIDGVFGMLFYYLFILKYLGIL